MDTLEVSGSFGSGLSSVIPFCHRIPITHGATSTTPSTREVAHERQEIDNAGWLQVFRELSRTSEQAVSKSNPHHQGMPRGHAPSSRATTLLLMITPRGLPRAIPAL